MNHHTIAGSSAIARIGYDEKAREMEIHFKSGKIYQYSDVDPEDHSALLSAESVGRHFGAHIRPKYEGRLHK